MFVLLAIVLLLLLPSPWNLVGFVVCLVLFPGEVYVWHRKVRGNRKVVGAQTLIGAPGTLVSVCPARRSGAGPRRAMGSSL